MFERVRERLDELGRREIVGLALIGLLVLGAGGLWYARSIPQPVRISTSGAVVPAGGPAGTTNGVIPIAAPSPSGGFVVVDVAGFVRHPGVFQLPAGDRIIDAIRRAGGARPGADLRSLNLAALLTDGQQILVLRRGSGVEIGSGGAGPGGAAGGTQTVNLNTATLDQLETLPGIGPALGQRIIDYREQHGPFHSVDELLNVSGIGEQRLSDLKDQVTV